MKLIYLTLICCSTVLYAKINLPKKINGFYSVSAHSKILKKKDLLSTLRGFINSSKPNRIFSSSGHKKSQNYLEALLKASATQRDDHFTTQSFSIDHAYAISKLDTNFTSSVEKNFKKDSAQYKKWMKLNLELKKLILDSKRKKTIAKNFSYFVAGESKKELILVAHYDSLGFDQKSRNIDLKATLPGADYNGTGVSILLGMIKSLPKMKPKHSIRFLFTDASGIGQLGSYHFINKFKHRSNILGVVNLQMLGHDSKHFDKTKKNYNFKVYLRDNAADKDFLKSFEKNKKKSSHRSLFTKLANNRQDFDHVEFWSKGVAAVTFSQDWENDFNEKRYQTANDFAESLNQTSFYKAYQYILEMSFSYIYAI